MSDPLATGLRFNRAAIFAAFKQAVRHVWVNADFVLDVIDMSDEAPVENVLASIAYAGNVTAIRDHLLRRAPHYTLRVSDGLLILPAVEVRRVLIHEAAHLGYRGHGADFRALVVAKGGVVAGAGVDSGGVIEAQVKMGARYKTVRTFPQDTPKDAERWVREQIDAARSGGQEHLMKWRLRWA